MLTRIAVVTVLFCIGILLLSACGLAPAPSLPYIEVEDFVLWQVSPDHPDRLLGTGRVDGIPGDVHASLVLLEPLCSQHTEFNLVGRMTAGTSSSSLTLSDRKNPDQLSLTGVFSSRRHGLTNYVLPFSGSLNLNNFCGHTGALPVEARLTPTFRQSWHSKQSAKPSVFLSLEKTEPSSGQSAYEWGSIAVFDSACFRRGSFVAMRGAAQTSLDATFTMDDGSTVFAAGLPTALERKKVPPIRSTFTISGGRCNGQTLQVDLTHL
jgi:hypothetical protein